MQSLIEAQYQDSDISVDPTTNNQNVVLTFYDATLPTQPWSGPNNSGQSSSTIRKGVVALQAKAGTAAATGDQTTPDADAGWAGLWVVAVAYGDTAIESGAIAEASAAPFITETLTAKISEATGDARYLKITAAQTCADISATAAGGANVWTASISPAPASLVDGMQVNIDFSETNTSAGPTLDLNSLGAVTITEADGATELPIGLLPLNAILRYRSAGPSWALISAAPITTGVISWNTRTGAVTLTSGDVTTALDYTPLDAAGSVSATGKISFVASATGMASVNIPQGSAPSSPVNGDVWTTAAGVYARIAGTTIQLASISGAVTSFNSRSGTVTLTTADVTTVLSGQSLTGKLSFPASSSGGPGVNFGQGAAPTSPANGDFWITSAGAYVQIASTTYALTTAPSATTAGYFATYVNATGQLTQQAPATASLIAGGADNYAPITSFGLANATVELALSDASTVAWNMANGFNANLVMTSAVGANRTLATPTYPLLGRTYFLRLIQSASGNNAMAFPSCFDFGSGGAPTLNTAANKRDAISLYCESTSPLSFVATLFKG